MSDKQFRMSKISVIIKEVDVEAEDERPLEVPMFDQTMSLLEMIKEKKVCVDSIKKNNSKTVYYLLLTTIFYMIQTVHRMCSFC